MIHDVFRDPMICFTVLDGVWVEGSWSFLNLERFCKKKKGIVVEGKLSGSPIPDASFANLFVQLAKHFSNFKAAVR